MLSETFIISPHKLQVFCVNWTTLMAGTPLHPSLPAFADGATVHPCRAQGNGVKLLPTFPASSSDAGSGYQVHSPTEICKPG